VIEYPELEIRNEDQMAAAAIARVSGGLTADIVNAQIEARRELLKLIDAGLDEPICAELTNANPSSPHTVILEAMAWMLSQGAYRFNRVPEANLIAFANLFGIVRRAATAATTLLRFTVDPPADTDVTIPAGTEVQSADGLYVFETIDALVIPFGDGSGETLARCTSTGHTLLSPNVLTVLIDTPAYTESVTNPNAVDSGLNLEPVAETLERVRQFQRRGLRIVTTKDLEDAILDEGLQGNGVVRAFPFVRNGDFASGVKLVGHTTVVAMTRTGDPIDVTASNRIALLLEQVVGNQFVYVVDPEYVDFNIAFDVKLKAGVLESAVTAAIELNLRNFYASSREQFGRPILRSEILAVIEGTAGVDYVVAGVGSILAAPTVDTAIAEYQLADLEAVTITVV
jgi:hypothetical protein